MNSHLVPVAVRCPRCGGQLLEERLGGYRAVRRYCPYCDQDQAVKDLERERKLRRERGW